MKYYGIYEGEIRLNNKGKAYKIVSIKDTKTVLIKFLENGWEKTTSAELAYRGAIRLPKYYVGQIVQDKFGEPVEIVEINKADDYLFQWSDGYQRRCQSSVIHLKTLMREKDSTRLNPRTSIGQTFTSNQGLEYEIIDRKCSDEILVKFLCEPPYEVWSSCGNVLKGNIHYPFLPTMRGKGIVGTFPVDVTSYQYRAWAYLFQRIYGKTSEQSHKNYGDCSIVSEWHIYENFYTWASEQIYQPGWHLDKDLLFKGNRVYGPETSIFLPREVNTFLTDRYNHRGSYPVGVTFHQRLGKYQATCSLDAEPEYLGLFDTAEEAFYTYKKVKDNQAKILAERWKNNLDERAYKALLNYEVCITD